MFDEIITKYENFSDALISEFVFNQNDNSKSIEIIINCMNATKDYEYEKIKIIFLEVQSFRFVENYQESSTFINSALLKKNNDRIVFDFFPLIYDEGLKENKNSDLKIECLNLTYKKL